MLEEGAWAGYEYTVLHNTFGYRCGYVRVFKGHPWYGKSYHEPIIESIETHMGITWANSIRPCDSGEDDYSWWLGFDCVHSCDAIDYSLPMPEGLAKAMPPLTFGSDERRSVKGVEYVRNECHSLCEQAAEAASKQPEDDSLEDIDIARLVYKADPDLLSKIIYSCAERLEMIIKDKEIKK